MITYAIKDTDLFLDIELNVQQERKYVLKIRDLPADDKPRERLLKLGPNALSLNELLTVVLGTGTTKEDVMAMSSRIIREYGEHALVGETNAEKMSKDLAIPLGKAMQIVAVGELGRRFFQRQEHGLATIRTPKDVFEYVANMRNLPKEHLRGLYLNTHHRIIHDEVISIGTINSNLIHPREVFKPAVEYGAVGVVLVHNHPSGIASPSEADTEITKQLVEAGKIVGIHVLDHVIVTKGGYSSINIDY